MSTIQFPPEERWDGLTDTVVFPAVVDAHRIICRISMEALMDHFGTYNDKAFDLFKSNRIRIQQIAARKIEQKRFESDGTILIVSNEVH